MPRHVVIRETAESDLPGVTAIYAQAVNARAGVFELEALGVAEMTRRWRTRVAKGYPHIVASTGEAVIGYASARRHRAGPAHRFLVEDSVYVAFDAQRAGVGQALLSELIIRCEALNFRQMIAAIAPENSSSVRLHERVGFRQVGRIEGFAVIDGQWCDTLLMQRALADGKSSPPRDN